ncbi:uncharacterized protein VICG_01710 [Vittaforma corneae ATCC 50505]|uniref:Uncharacterized protein n=1 Tax=Vittaforma corneae (strain ATCC 50505) TaxID=993615 RepID=L2GK50_VITCO|nr:uncharacterized protein VICG_01710 [Vittaforma corneae ATCC 50505]ELA41221.1 hypothetical protein VICG_01710 [Vittaforma corneae ATCC 50505]
MNNIMEKLDDLYNMATDYSGAVIPENVLTVLENMSLGPLMAGMYKFFNCSAGLDLYLGVLCTVVLLAYLMINRGNYDQYKPFFITGYCLLFAKIAFYAYACIKMSDLIAEKYPIFYVGMKYCNPLYIYGPTILLVELLVLGFLQDLLFRSKEDGTRRFATLFKWFFMILRIITNVGFYHLLLPLLFRIHYSERIAIMMVIGMQLLIFYVLPFVVYSLIVLISFLLTSNNAIMVNENREHQNPDLQIIRFISKFLV